MIVRVCFHDVLVELVRCLVCLELVPHNRPDALSPSLGLSIQKLKLPNNTLVPSFLFAPSALMAWCGRCITFLFLHLNNLIVKT